MQIAVNILILLDLYAMTTLQTKEELQVFLAPFKKNNKGIGFVPTMGALHQGHLSLVTRALEECDLVVVSIFVNPTQFNNTEDLAKYPRNVARDIAQLRSISQEIIVFTPTPENIYGPNISARQYDFGPLGHFMEGAHRPGHFDGVATVVSLLFDAVTPNRAYFGEKDYQQLRIVETMVAVEGRDTVIVPCTIARNAKGLALSSRNERLNDQQRDQALLLSRVLLEAREQFTSNTIESIKEQAVAAFSNAPEFDLEYFEIADTETMVPTLNKEPNKKYRAFIAAQLNSVRLIDNLELN